MASADGLRFCMVTTFYPPYHFGGDGVYVYRLAEALAERGHRVDVIHSMDAYHLSHPANPEVSFDHHPNVMLHSLRSRQRILRTLTSHQLGSPGFYGRKLRSILNKNRYDVIHYHNVSLMGAPGVFELGSAVKLYTTHEYWLICPTHVLFKMNREPCVHKECLKCTLHAMRPPQWWRYTGAMARGLEAIDCVLSPSRFALARHRQDGIGRPMMRLPHFVPAPLPTPLPGEGKEAAAPEGEYFLYVGRLEKLKGPAELVRIFGNYRKANLLVVGAGVQEAELRLAAKDLPHVKFLGALHPTKLAALYRGALGVIVPSLCYETFGLTAAEAMMNGTVAIVRRIGALTEIVEETGGGYAFSTDEECVEAMESLRTHPDARRAMIARGQERARELWSQSSHLERYLKLVRSMLAGRSQRAAEANVIPMDVETAMD